MKRVIAAVLLFVMLCISAAVLAETWTCPNCRKESEGNFCSWCGTAKPKPVVVCANCGAEYDSAMGYLYCSNCGTPLAGNTNMSGVAVGDIIPFGSYEQDNNPANGPEAIEWIVLDVQDGKALLLSKYALDAKPYNTEWGDITWGECTLRSWLNNDFLNAAFSKTEQRAILTTEVDNSNEQGYGEWDTTGGNDTQDQIFLLSYHETFDLYFVNDDARMCLPTDYAVANGAWTSSSNDINGVPTGWWWLRSPGDRHNFAAIVFFGGSLVSNRCNRDDGVVRPALWVDLESGII